MELETDDAMDEAVGETGEEASLGASGSSGAEWIGAEDEYHFNFIGQETTAGTEVVTIKLKRDRV